MNSWTLTDDRGREVEISEDELAAAGFAQIGAKNAERFLRLSRDIEKLQDLVAVPRLEVRFEAKEKDPEENPGALDDPDALR